MNRKKIILSLIYIVVTIFLILYSKIKYTFLNTMLFVVISIFLEKDKKEWIYISLTISNALIFITEYMSI